jgi:hypothetical protein
MACVPQRGGWQRFWLTTKEWSRNFLTGMAESLFSMKFKSVAIMDFLPHIPNIPILYFYGKDDLMVSRHEFEMIWNATPNTQKTVIITSNPHVWNHLKQKELYKLICDLFVQLPHKECIACLQDANSLIADKTSKLIACTTPQKNY